MSPLSPRDLPPIHALIDHPLLLPMVARLGRAAVVRASRAAVDEARARIVGGNASEVDPTSLVRRAMAILDGDRPALRSVLNATGILLHTGLGRAPLAAEAVAAAAAVATGYCNLEIDLDTGDRGKRTTGVAELLRRLTGAEAATVVNNNAGATVLALRALALGREVVVSRGQLIEIGGSFRLPEILAVSGAKLREVGTTNRTRLSDYDRAIGPETAVLLRVHPSNYRVVGFTESVGITELAVLAHERGLAVVDDIGSGALGPSRPPHVSGEPTVAEGLAAGADLVLASGDKLLGGPQCGLLLGTRAAVAKAEADPLMRALRVDKMTLAALEATLRLALDPALAVRKIPLWSFLTTPGCVILDRAKRLAESWRRDPGLDASMVETTGFLGGGSLPAEPIPSAAIRVVSPLPDPWRSEDSWVRALRRGETPVVPRIQGGGVLFDLRAIDPADDDRLSEAVRRVTRSGPSSDGPIEDC